MLKSTDIVSSNFDWNFDLFNPMVYEKEPYDLDEYAKEHLEHYLEGLEYLYRDYEATHNEYYKMLVERLLPAGMKMQSN